MALLRIFYQIQLLIINYSKQYICIKRRKHKKYLSKPQNSLNWKSRTRDRICKIVINKKVLQLCLNCPSLLEFGLTTSEKWFLKQYKMWSDSMVQNILILSPLVLSKWENLMLLSSVILTEREETKTRYFAPMIHCI